jgi:hypothetical protein
VGGHFPVVQDAGGFLVLGWSSVAAVSGVDHVKRSGENASTERCLGEWRLLCPLNKIGERDPSGGRAFAPLLLMD